MPSLDPETFLYNYKAFDDLLICLIVFKFLSLLYKIYFEQSQLDIFFIDWETPKRYRFGESFQEGVNPWRRLYLANEFNELQGQKHLNSEGVLLLFICLADGFGL